MDAAEALQQVDAGPEHQVVGVVEDDLGTSGASCCNWSVVNDLTEWAVVSDLTDASVPTGMNTGV